MCLKIPSKPEYPSIPKRQGHETVSSPYPHSHWVPTHLHKGVDSHDGHIRLTLGIIH